MVKISEGAKAVRRAKQTHKEGQDSRTAERVEYYSEVARVEAELAAKAERLEKLSKGEKHPGAYFRDFSAYWRQRELDGTWTRPVLPAYSSDDEEVSKEAEAVAEQEQDVRPDWQTSSSVQQTARQDQRVITSADWQPRVSAPEERAKSQRQGRGQIDRYKCEEPPLYKVGPASGLPPPSQPSSLTPSQAKPKARKRAAAEETWTGVVIENGHLIWTRINQQGEEEWLSAVQTTGRNWKIKRARSTSN
jgi:hypothetical protein